MDRVPGRVVLSGSPESGRTGELNELMPRADFRVSDFDKLVDAQGSRLAWARAARCPCHGANTQTGQPNPRCSLGCGGRGWQYFGPIDYKPDFDVGQLDALQRSIVDRYGAAVIRGVFYSASLREETYGSIGPWKFGKAMITVRPVNVLGFYDRIIDLDSEISYTEVVEIEWSRGLNAGPLEIVPRFPVIGLNLALDDAGVRYRTPEQLRVLENGNLAFVPSIRLAEGTRLSLHYLAHAHWRVIDHPHAARHTQTKLRQRTPITPRGTPTALPIQAALQLEHLVPEGDR